MTVRHEWDIRDADVELERLQDGFSGRDHARFAQVLMRNFEFTQFQVHVITGSLRSSGKAEVTASGDEKWEGYISYGGPSQGIHNPVKYAAHEWGKPHDAGYDHDFMRATEFIDEEMLAALSGLFDRGRGPR